MAEGVVSDIALRLLEVLGSRLYQEIELAFGVKDEIEKLMETVGTIKAVLVDAEEKHSKKNAEVTEWLQRLKDAFYDADDLLDDFATQLKQREAMSGNKITKEVRIFFSESNQIAYSVKMAHKIKAVRSKLEEINNDRKFHLTENLAETRVGSTEREQTHSFVREEMVIGRDDEKNEIIKLLLLEPNDQDENVFVIPIVGMGGLGKTTLAQLVYNDEQVKNHFELRMWVCVSEQFDLKIILEKIINSVTNEKPEDLDMDQLQNKLREKINNKKYLLVLDDIWNEIPAKWNELKDLLINGARGSKILVTTRSQEVAKITNRDLSYNLQGLNKDKSWLLFIKKAFDKGIVPEDSEQLVEIGKEIVAKCGGLPLVISTIGSLLNSDISENYWSSVNNEMFETIGNDSGILSTLRLSYDQLPSHLKHCFAFSALFPKDFKIKKQQLISLWIAQGFFESSNKDQFLEDIGNKYFMNLLKRSFFQDPEYDVHGNIITCKMHDFMHDLAQSVGGVECTFITAATNDHIIGNRCRHLSIYCSLSDNIGNVLDVLGRAKPIRSLLFLAPLLHKPSCIDPHEIFSRYRYLRALDFSGVSLKKLSHKISKLKHLRYLNLSAAYIEKLPNSIVKLKNLEKLDLSYCAFLIELPRNMRKMVNLKDVIILGCYGIKIMPLGLWGLSDGETLTLILVCERNYRRYKKCGSVSYMFNRMVGRMFSYMTLRNLEHDNAKLSNYIQKMEFLQLLGQPHNRSETDGRSEKMLEGPNLKDIEISYFDGVKLPTWPSSATNLTSITVTYCKRCRYIPELDELPSLERLHLRELDDLEYISDKATTLSTTFFPSLREITLVRCGKLKGWWRIDDDDDGATQKYLPSFARLSTLEIISCPNLTSMPPYPSIEELTLVDTSWKPLRQTMMMVNSVGPSTSSAPLSKLKSLTTNSIDDLEFPIEDVLQFVSSLELQIFDCKNFKALPELMPNLTRMEIENCQNLKALPESMPNLTGLTIADCPNLKALPESMLDLTWMEIDNCPNLKALPESMPKLTSLNIYKCPQFSENYGNKEGKDWPKIAHIPNITINSIRIQGGYVFNSERDDDDDDGCKCLGFISNLITMLLSFNTKK